LAVRAGDEPLALRASQRLAMALAYRGDPVTANALAERGLARARALGLGHAQSGLLNVLTICADLLGDRLAGLRYSLLDLSLNRQTGKRAHEAVALSNVGMSYLGFGAFDEARQYLEQALQLNRALGNRQVEGNTLAMLSELAWREGNPALALTCARAAHDISIEVNSPLHRVDSLWSLGNAELEHGRWSEAAAAFVRSETLARETELKPQVMSALDGQIRVALVCGDALKAQRLEERLLEAARATATSAAACATSATDSATGDSLSPDLFTGTYEHLLRLTLCRIHIGSDDRRAELRLAEAYAALMAEADRILDDGLRRSFLTKIPEHREIIALHAAHPGLWR
jgi:tetratricopeptide (TPR) repeat protein